ncbi:ATPase, partial [Aerococcaceae bacterium NML171108]|nr:ATPase [Aerococcaceae bacterium NML171108]
MSRGSEFRKWDLHVHSPYTILNNQYAKLKDGRPDIEAFISKIQDNGISAIGLTNYFNFTENDFALKDRLEGEGIKVFFNLEVRLSNLNDSQQLFDYHIIFDDLLDEKIIRNVLAELKANVGDTTKSFNMLSKEEIEHKAYIDFQELIKKLDTDKQLNGRYLKGFLSRGYGNARTKAASLYENICLNSDFIIHSSCNNPQECKNKKCSHNNSSIDREYWLNESGYIRPLIQSSDAHSLEQIGKKYTWIKSDLTFEGLKQIKFEPEYRISLDKNKPSLDKDELIIDRFTYRGKDIHLSENLNSIIGGRSTGKSTLLNSIAKKLGTDIGESYSFEDIEQFHIYWRDGNENNSRKVQYIPQDYMYSLARDGEKLKKLLDEIIKSKGLDSSIRDYNQKCSKLNVEISRLLHQYKEILSSLDELVEPEAEEDATIERISVHKNSRERLLESMNVSKEESASFEEMNETLKKLKENSKKTKKDLEIIQTLSLSKMTIIELDFNEPSKEIEDKIRDLIEEINQDAQDKFDDFLESIKSELLNLISENDKEIRAIESSNLCEKYTHYITSNTEVNKLASIIKSEEEMLATIKRHKDSKKKLEEAMSQLKDQIINRYRKYSQFREELHKEFVISDEEGLTIS